jgi:hypothetical protein
VVLIALGAQAVGSKRLTADSAIVAPGSAGLPRGLGRKHRFRGRTPGPVRLWFRVPTRCRARKGGIVTYAVDTRKKGIPRLRTAPIVDASPVQLSQESQFHCLSGVARSVTTGRSLQERSGR